MFGNGVQIGLDHILQAHRLILRDQQMEHPVCCGEVRGSASYILVELQIAASIILVIVPTMTGFDF